MAAMKITWLQILACAKNTLLDPVFFLPFIGTERNVLKRVKHMQHAFLLFKLFLNNVDGTVAKR